MDRNSACDGGALPEPHRASGRVVITTGRGYGRHAASDALARLLDLDGEAPGAIGAPVRTVREDVVPTRAMGFAVARVAERNAARAEVEDTFRAIIGRAAEWTDVRALVSGVLAHRP